MGNILFLVILAGIGWCVYRTTKQLPINPFADRAGKATDEEDALANGEERKQKNKKLIREFLGIQDIKMNMLWLPRNEYVLALRCEPVNYHLRNGIEQEGIDVRFEQWLTTMDYPVVWHLQSRFLDLKHQLETYTKTIEEDRNLNERAKNYSYTILDYLRTWLTTQPRYEVVRYVLFPLKMKGSMLKKSGNADRALRELLRRAVSAQNFLEGCGVKSEICMTEDLCEMIYYALNRKRAASARFQDVRLQEMLALYCTSEQDSIRVKKVIVGLKKEQVS
jgi:hypothetical protein